MTDMLNDMPRQFREAEVLGPATGIEMPQAEIDRVRAPRHRRRQTGGFTGGGEDFGNAAGGGGHGETNDIPVQATFATPWPPAPYGNVPDNEIVCYLPAVRALIASIACLSLSRSACLTSNPAYSISVSLGSGTCFSMASSTGISVASPWLEKILTTVLN